MGKGSLLERLGLARKPPLSLEAFRESVIEEVLRRRPELQIERIGEAEIPRPGRGVRGDVARGYAYYREQPRERDLVISQLADLVLFEPESAKPLKLLSGVRPDAVRAGRMERKTAAPRQPSRDLASDAMAARVSTPLLLGPFPYADLRTELGMEDDAIWDRAMTNLRARLDLTPPKPRPGYLMGLKTGIGLASACWFSMTTGRTPTSRPWEIWLWPTRTRRTDSRAA